MSNADVYKKVTERVVGLLEQGTVPWHKPWVGGQRGLPRNLISKRPYHGCNVFFLAVQQYESPYWLTFHQLKQLAGCDQPFCKKPHEHGLVIKGEKGTPIVFWRTRQFTQVNQATGEDETVNVPLARIYTVFNVAQVTGIEDKLPDRAALPDNDLAPLDACERIIHNMPQRPEIRHQEQRAYYRPLADFVNLPLFDTFESAEAYYSTAYHELGHATGHKSRLNRATLNDLVDFGDTNYSQEELVAEFTAAFLCGIAGIENTTVNTSAAYLKGWISRLQADPQLLTRAASQAQAAADYILHVQPEQAVEGESDAVAE